MPNLRKKIQQVVTLESFIENEYRSWVFSHRKAAADSITRIKRCFCKSYGNKKLDEITPFLIEQWRSQKLKSGRSIGTVNRDVATFKAAISKAVEWGFVSTNPIENLKLFKEDHSAKIRYLSKDEEQRLRIALTNREERIRRNRANGNSWRIERGYDELTNLHTLQHVDYLSPMILISINTGLRRGELFNLTWNDIDFSKALLTIGGEISKSGKTRHVPLNNEALTVLEGWRKQSETTGFIFKNKSSGEKINSVKKAWATVLKDAQIENFR